MYAPIQHFAHEARNYGGYIAEHKEVSRRTEKMGKEK